MQIIKHGKVDDYKKICSRCGCEFTYSLSDLSHLLNGDIGACPECGKEFTHRPDSPEQPLTVVGTASPETKLEGEAKTFSVDGLDSKGNPIMTEKTDTVGEALVKWEKAIEETAEALGENSASDKVQPIVEIKLEEPVKEAKEEVIQATINYPESKPLEGKTQFAKEAMEAYNKEALEPIKPIPEWIKPIPVEKVENTYEAPVTQDKEFPLGDFVKSEGCTPAQVEGKGEPIQPEVEPKTEGICQENPDPFGISLNIPKPESSPIFRPTDGLDRKLPEAQGPSVPGQEPKPSIAHQGPGYANSSSDMGYFGNK